MFAQGALNQRNINNQEKRARNLSYIPEKYIKKPCNSHTGHPDVKKNLKKVHIVDHLNLDNPVNSMEFSNEDNKYASLASEENLLSDRTPKFKTHHKNSRSHFYVESHEEKNCSKKINQNKNQNQNNLTPTIPRKLDTIQNDAELSDFNLDHMNHNHGDGTIIYNHNETAVFKHSKISNLEDIIGLEMSKNFKNKKKNIGELSKFVFANKSKFLESVTFDDTKKLEFLNRKKMYNSLLQCIISFISIISSIIEYDINFRINSPDGIKMISQNSPVQSSTLKYLNGMNLFVLWVCFISSIILWVLIIFDYLIKCEILHYQKRISDSIWRTETKNLLFLISTLIIFFLHPNPVFKDIKVPVRILKYKVTLYYSLNSIFGLISLFRLWFFIKYYLVSSEYNTTRVQRICEMNNFKSNLVFSLKASMKKNPSSLLFIMFMITLLFCSFGLRIFEH
jgi:hypothetical protein